MAVILIFCSICQRQQCSSRPSSTNVGQRRPTSRIVLSVKSESRVDENVGQPLESRRDLLPLKSYFQFRFASRHLESIVNNVTHRSGVVENVGVAVEIMSVCRWKLLETEDAGN